MTSNQLREKLLDAWVESGLSHDEFQIKTINNLIDILLAQRVALETQATLQHNAYALEARKAFDDTDERLRKLGIEC